MLISEGVWKALEDPKKEAHMPNSACIVPIERAGGAGHGWMRLDMACNVGFLMESASGRDLPVLPISRMQRVPLLIYRIR